MFSLRNGKTWREALKFSIPERKILKEIPSDEEQIEEKIEKDFVSQAKEKKA